MDYGNALRIIRSSRNMSQVDLAENAKLDPSYISLIEKSKRTPSMETLKKVTQVLNVPLHLFVLLSSNRRDIQNLSARKRSDIAEILLDLLLDSESYGSNSKT